MLPASCVIVSMDFRPAWLGSLSSYSATIFQISTMYYLNSSCMRVKRLIQFIIISIVAALPLGQVLIQYQTPGLKLEQYFSIKEYFGKGPCYCFVCILAFLIKQPLNFLDLLDCNINPFQMNNVAAKLWEWRLKYAIHTAWKSNLVLFEQRTSSMTDSRFVHDYCTSFQAIVFCTSLVTGAVI